MCVVIFELKTGRLICKLDSDDIITFIKAKSQGEQCSYQHCIGDSLFNVFVKLFINAFKLKFGNVFFGLDVWWPSA